MGDSEDVDEDAMELENKSSSISFINNEVLISLSPSSTLDRRSSRVINSNK